MKIVGYVYGRDVVSSSRYPFTYEADAVPNKDDLVDHKGTIWKVMSRTWYPPDDEGNAPYVKLHLDWHIGPKPAEVDDSEKDLRNLVEMGMTRSYALERGG